MGVVRESLFAEVEFRSKPDVDECLRHLDIPSLSAWSLSSGIVLAMLRKKGSSQDKDVSSKPGIWLKWCSKKSSKTNQSTANHSWAPGQNNEYVNNRWMWLSIIFSMPLWLWLTVVTGLLFLSMFWNSKIQDDFCGTWIARSSPWFTGDWAINWIPRHLVWKRENYSINCSINLKFAPSVLVPLAPNLDLDSPKMLNMQLIMVPTERLII